MTTLFLVCSTKGDTGRTQDGSGAAAARRSFGRGERLPSGNYRAGYTGPDGQLYRASTTFDAKGDAIAWLSARRAEIQMEVWAPDVASRGARRRESPTFRSYADLAPGRETIRAQSYSLLRTIFASAASERPTSFILYNPAHIRGTRRGRPPDDQTSAGTTYATPGRCWPPRPEQRWPS